MSRPYKPAYSFVGKTAPRGESPREKGFREASISLVTQATRIGNMRKPPHPDIQMAYDARRDLKAGWKLSTDQLIACKRILRDAAKPHKAVDHRPARSGQADLRPSPKGVGHEPVQGAQGSR